MHDEVRAEVILFKKQLSLWSSVRDTKMKIHIPCSPESRRLIKIDPNCTHTKINCDKL